MAKHDSKSMPDAPAKTTEKNVFETSKKHHKTESTQEHTDNTVDEVKCNMNKGFFPFGTPLKSIVKFTSEVEVFTRHIDAFTRDSFNKPCGSSENKK